MTEFFDGRPVHERGFLVIEEPVVTLTPDGQFRIEGGRFTGGDSDAVFRLVLERARQASARLRDRLSRPIGLAEEQTRVERSERLSRERTDELLRTSETSLLRD